ncbi:MAG: hypothetical protein ACE5K4_10030 [Candidatus Hydrothermarchaeota archaeon]
MKRNVNTYLMIINIMLLFSLVFMGIYAGIQYKRANRLIDELNSQSENLIVMLQSKEKQYNLTLKTLNITESKIEALKEKYTKLDAEKTNLERKLRNTEKELEKTKSDLKDLRQDYNEKLIEIETLNARLSAYKEENADLKAALNQYKLELLVALEEIDDLRDEVDNLEEELAACRAGSTNST